MRGFVQIPIIVIILLISGGFITAYIVTHRDNLTPSNQVGETTSSTQEASPSSEPSKEVDKPADAKTQKSSSPTPKTSGKPSAKPTSNTSSGTSNTSSFKSSSANVVLTPPSNSSTPNGSSQLTVELYAIDPYYTTGKIASFKVNGSVSGLKGNTSYWVAFSPPNDPGGAVGVLDFTTNSSGSALISIGGKGISYYPSSSQWSIGVYPKGDASVAAVKGSFNISSDTISANNPSNTSPSSVKLDSISPNPTKYGDVITLKGSGFGSSGQYVVFTNPQGFTSGAGVISWSDTEIKAYVPPTKGENKVQVEGPNSTKSNIYTIQVTAGQPYISSSPYSAVPGREITISGEEFQNSTGVVNLYGPNSATTSAGNCSITSWSDTQIKCTLPSSLSTTGYYDISIVTSDGRRGSNKTLYMCSPTGCG